MCFSTDVVVSRAIRSGAPRQFSRSNASGAVPGSPPSRPQRRIKTGTWTRPSPPDRAHEIGDPAQPNKDEIRADAVERRALPGKRSAEANYAGGSGTMQLAGT